MFTNSDSVHVLCVEMDGRFPFKVEMYFIRVLFKTLRGSFFHTVYFSLVKSLHVYFVLCPYYETSALYSYTPYPPPPPSPTYNTTRLCFSPLSWVAGCKGWVIIGLLGYIQAGWRAGGRLVTGFPFFGGELGRRESGFFVYVNIDDAMPSKIQNLPLSDVVLSNGQKFSRKRKPCKRGGVLVVSE
jgi:hypothetical protein